MGVPPFKETDCVFPLSFVWWDRRIDGPGCQVVWNLAFIVYATFRKRCLGRNWQRKSSQGEAKPSAKLIKLKFKKHHHVLFWVLNKQTSASIINIFQNKKTPPGGFAGVFFLTPKKSIPRRRVDVVGPDVWCVTWLDSRGANDIWFSNPFWEPWRFRASPICCHVIAPWRNHHQDTMEDGGPDPQKFGGKPDDLIFGFVAGKKSGKVLSWQKIFFLEQNFFYHFCGKWGHFWRTNVLFKDVFKKVVVSFIKDGCFQK